MAAPASAQVWSGWQNRDRPGGKGDYETVVDFIKDGTMPCKQPVAIECRLVGSGRPVLTGMPAGYTCDVQQGGYCVNKPGVNCQDIEVRFACPAPGPIAVPAVGDTRACSQPGVTVAGMHYPRQTCAQSQTDFTSNALKNFHLASKCPSGQALKGVDSISCQNAPIAGYGTGSVYTATTCCSAPAPAPAPAPPDVRDLPMQGGDQHTACPPLGAALPRSAATTAPYLGIMLANLDQRCASVGPGFKLTAIKFLSCAPDSRGPGFGPPARADIICGP